MPRAGAAPFGVQATGMGRVADARPVSVASCNPDAVARIVPVGLPVVPVTRASAERVPLAGRLGDISETHAIKKTFGEHAKTVSISATKSMTGHLLGGAGAVEMAACALAIRDGVIPPTINLDNPDEQCDLDYTPHTAREKKVKVAINNSFGFGGHNATLVAKAFD